MNLQEHVKLIQSQVKMKQWYDKDVRIREFKPGEKVLVSLSGHPLQAIHGKNHVNLHLTKLRLFL